MQPAWGQVLPPEPGKIYGDSTFASAKSDRLIVARGGTPLTVQTGVLSEPETLARLRIHNAVLRKVRCRNEKVFGTCKRSYGQRRKRWLGLDKAEFKTTCIALLRHNTQKFTPATS